MTPTFAAGLGMVIAAALASGLTRHVLRYDGPDRGQPCAVKGCDVPGNGSLASAKPGRQLRAPAHGRPGKAAAPPRPRVAAGGDASGPGRGVVVTYRTMREDWQGTFEGMIVLASRNGRALRSWTLRFTYPDGQIRSVSAAGGRPVPYTAHAATVTGGQSEGDGWWGQQAQVIFSVRGRPGPPAGCFFDGHACHYVTASGG